MTDRGNRTPAELIGLDVDLDADLRRFFDAAPNAPLPSRVAAAVTNLPDRPRTSGRFGPLGSLAGSRPMAMLGVVGSIAVATVIAGTLFAFRQGSAPAGSLPSAAGSSTSAASRQPTASPAISLTPTPATPSATPSASPSAAGSVQGIDSAQAIAAVESFLAKKLSDAQASGPTVWPGGRYWEIRSTVAAVTAWVDAARGNVIYLYLPAPETTVVKITANQAEDAASLYLTSHGIPIDGLTVTVTLEDHGAGKNYVVAYQRHVGDVLVPDSRNVFVDPQNGDVFTFMDRRIPYGTVPTPLIDRKTATDKAIAASGISPAKITSAQLSMTSKIPMDPIRLYWMVAVDTAQPNVDLGSIVAVDAITGETTVIGGH